MVDDIRTLDEALVEIEELRARLEEAEESIKAIQSGEVDAVIISGPEGEQIYTLTGAERTYRLLVEAMNEGALLLSPDGTIIYCNRTFAAMLSTPIYDVLGHAIYEFIAKPDIEPLRHMLEYAPLRNSKREVELKHNSSGSVPAFISVGNLETDDGQSISAVVTDLTEHKLTEAELELYRKHLEELVVERTKELAMANEQLVESEKRVTSILESISDGFIAYDEDWRFIYLNDEGERQIHQLTGRSREYLLGKVLWEELPPFDESEIGEHYRKAMAEQTAGAFEQFYPHFNKWYMVRMFPSPRGLSVYSEDITERKQAEEAVVKARTEAEQWSAQLESFVSSMADGIVLFDSERKVLMINDLAKQMLGSPPEMPAEVWTSGHELYSLDGDKLPRDQWPSERALRGEKTKDVRYKMVTPWGEALVAISGSPVKDAQGRVIGGTLSFRDVSSRLQFEQEREELLEREHRIAEVLQQALVPPRVPKEIGNFRIGVKYQSALREAEIGGDFYDVFDLDDGKIGVLLGDVAGKGLAAAIRVAAARYSIRSYAFIDPQPSFVMTLANGTLCKDTGDESQILTAFFMVIDPCSRSVTYTSAGQEPPVICKANGTIEELAIGGMPLGVSPDASYSQTSIQLSPGDTIVLVTDGITEARAPGVILFEKKGLIEYLAQNAESEPEETASGILDAATSHAGGHLQDDAAIVVVRLETGKLTGCCKN